MQNKACILFDSMQTVSIFASQERYKDTQQ